MLNPDKLAHHAEQLRSVLAGAGRVYAASPEDQRTAVLAALEAVYEFVEDVALEGVDALPKGEMLKPLSAIYMAFADLDRGVTPPLLKPKLVGDKLGRGRRRDSLGREQMKGGVAAAMSLLMIFGFTLEDAGKLVAKELRRLKVAFGSKRGDWRTIASWRELCMAAPARGDEEIGMATHYRIVLDMMAEVPGWPPAPDQLDPQARARFRDAVLANLQAVSLLAQSGC